MATTETAASRYNRDWAQMKDDRKARGLDAQPAERRERLYVDAETEVSAAA